MHVLRTTKLTTLLEYTRSICSSNTSNTTASSDSTCIYHSVSPPGWTRLSPPKHIFVVLPSTRQYSGVFKDAWLGVCTYHVRTSNVIRQIGGDRAELIPISRSKYVQNGLGPELKLEVIGPAI